MRVVYAECMNNPYIIFIYPMHRYTAPVYPAQAPNQPAAAPAVGNYSAEQLAQLAQQFPEIDSAGILAQISKSQSPNKRSDSSSKGKSKKKGEGGYERLAAAYERLASVLEKAFKEDAPKPPMPPRAPTPGHRSPSPGQRYSRRSQSRSLSRSLSPGRPSTPTRDEGHSSGRRTVIFPGKQYQLF